MTPGDAAVASIATPFATRNAAIIETDGADDRAAILQRELAMRFICVSVLAASLSLLAAPVSAATTLFGSRAAFLAAVGTSFTDTYEADLGYPVAPEELDDAAMSAVVGETRYETTGIPGNNLLLGIAGGSAYCSGCQGSFTLHFDDTSFGNGGVFGVALDIVANAARPFSSLITFGDGSTQLLLLGNGGTPGVTSDKLIRSIAFGVDGRPTDNGFFAIDNLTIASSAGAVPEPASWALLIAGFGLTGAAMRRRRMPVVAA